MVLNFLTKAYLAQIFLLAGHNFHGRYEYVPVESMVKATEVIIGIAQKVAEKYQ